MEKYYVDKRVGCVAVREKVDYEVSPGCHSGLPDVVAFWGGRRIENDEPPVFWEVYEWQIEKAERLCDLLNGLSPRPAAGER
jgi:hypothetical protein